MSPAELWASRIQEVIQDAADDGYDVWVVDDFDSPRIEVRIGGTEDDEGAVILGWNA